MRLVDADDAKRSIWREWMSSRTTAETELYDILEKLIVRCCEHIDSARGVEIVRCKECEHHHWDQEPCHGKTIHYCELPHMRGVEVFKDFYCYYGKHREKSK